MGLKDISIPRPLTYVLMAKIIDELSAQLTGVTIQKVLESTLYAVLTLSKDGKTLELDCRPSDAMCLAVQTDTPIRVATELFDQLSAKKSNVLKWRGKALEMDGSGIGAIETRVRRTLAAEVRT